MSEDKGSFVCTIPLAAKPRDRSILRTRMEQARQAYNALLGECLKRLRRMRQSQDWRAAGKMPKGKDRCDKFWELCKRFEFRQYDLYRFIQEQRKNGPFQAHLDATTMQAIAARAFESAERFLFKGDRPRFRRKGEIRAVEGVSARSTLHWDSESRRIVWYGLSLPAIIDPSDEVIAHGLKHRVRYSRIIRKIVRGKEYYQAQLVLEGQPLRKAKHATGAGVVGLDIGPSTIAIVGPMGATLETFCGEIEDTRKKVSKLQSAESRKRRINNPQNFASNGVFKPRRQQSPWRISNRQRRLANERAEFQRREAAHRKCLHGRLVNKIIAAGNDIRTEKLSYQSFQRNFGRSSGFRAPGMFVDRLKKSAAKAGATVTEFQTRKTMLSQTCPKCGTLRKKKLSERQHVCSCGANVQRDIASAFLARYVVGDRLDTSAACKAWKGQRNVLCAVSGVNNGTTGGASAYVHPAKGQSPSRVKSHRNPVSVAVARRATKKPEEDAVTNQLWLFRQTRDDVTCGQREPKR